jgi:beta subunit of N-acylethanolamine-hydrolyzing acid amidase
LDIPTYTLNLDLPPHERWKHIIPNYPTLHSMIMSIISQILDSLVPEITKPLVRLIMAGTLTKLANDEFTEELKGISDISGCPLWALIAYNICYDFMAGCSSGGMKTIGEDGKEEFFHYRNLDWPMEETRATTIQVIYTRGGKSILEAIHYVGMVGIATGVRYVLSLNFGNDRQGLSCSINFRARTNESTSTMTRIHQTFGTAFGHRSDITCIVREMLTSGSTNIDSIIAKLRVTESAPAYLILCSPEKVAILEKDYESARVATSNRFLACANHDNELEEWTEQEFEEWAEEFKDPLISSSRERRQCAIDGSHHVKNVQDLKNLLQTWPIVNTLTTFGVIMSPDRGTIDWGAWYKERPMPARGMEKWGGEFTPTS